MIALTVSLGACRVDPNHHHHHPPADTTDTVPEGPLLLEDPTARLHEELGSVIYAGWTQSGPATVHVEYTFEDGLWRSSPARERAAGTHEELLLGIPYGTEVTWRVVAEPAGGEPITLGDQLTPTGSGIGIPQATVTVGDAEAQDPAEFFLVGLAAGFAYRDSWWTLVVDRRGRTVWALLSPYHRTSRQPRIASDGGSLLLDRSSFFPEFDQGAASTVDQVLLDGSVVHTFPTPGLHHPFTELPDGAIAYGRSVGWSQGHYVDEQLAIVHLDGSTETLWDCAEFLASVGSAEECMSNTLNYDVPTNRFFFSFFTSETVFEIDRDSGDVARWFGHLPGAYAFDGAAFWWQHGGHRTATGTFLTSSDLTEDPGTETVVREYEIDAATETLHEVWNLGVGDGIYGFQLGEALRLDGGNTLQNFGRLARLREAAPSGEIVWDLHWASDGLGHTFPIADTAALYAMAPVLP